MKTLLFVVLFTLFYTKNYHFLVSKHNLLLQLLLLLQLFSCWCGGCYCCLCCCRRRRRLVKVRWTESHKNMLSTFKLFRWQCDQIWRNLSTLAKYTTTLATFSIDKSLNLFWQKNCYWANFHCCKWPNIKLPSGRSVRRYHNNTK